MSFRKETMLAVGSNTGFKAAISLNSLKNGRMNTNYLLIAIIIFMAVYCWPKKQTSTRLIDQENDPETDDENQIFIQP